MRHRASMSWMNVYHIHSAYVQGVFLHIPEASKENVVLRYVKLLLFQKSKIIHQLKTTFVHFQISSLS